MLFYLPASMIAIGGVGGSGTRVIASALQSMGFYLGSDLNQQKDNLWFTLLFKRREVPRTSDSEFRELVEIFCDAMHGRLIVEPDRIHLVRSLAVGEREFNENELVRPSADTLLAARVSRPNGLVGWKEPNTHIVLDRLLPLIPDLRYIHVMRNGRDMAFSRNQKQVCLWGSLITGLPYQPRPAYALHYWRKAHERINRIARDMGDRFLLVNFEEFCGNPMEGISRIAGFAGISLDEKRRRTISAGVEMPESVGRFRDHDLSLFDPADVAYVAGCGFPTR
jgi:hypothetical protein